MASSGWRSTLARFWLVTAGGLLLMGLWQLGSIEQSRQQVLVLQAHRLSMLTHFQMEVAHCERLVIALGASQARSVQVGGLNPRALRHQLQHHAAEATRLFSMLHAALEPMLQESDVPQSLRWAFVRVEAEWLQLHASLQEYFARADGQILTWRPSTPSSCPIRIACIARLNRYMTPLHGGTKPSGTRFGIGSGWRWRSASWGAFCYWAGYGTFWCVPPA